MTSEKTWHPVSNAQQGSLTIAENICMERLYLCFQVEKTNGWYLLANVAYGNAIYLYRVLHTLTIVCGPG